MKRHSALVPLSHDHHHALVIAQQLKRANRVTGRRAQAAFLDYWDRDGQRHFREEEELLLPRCVGYLDIEQPLVAKVLTDHIAIRHLATELAAPGTSQPERLHELGEKLEEHIRMEERQVFPLIEDSLPEAELQRLDALLDH